MTQQRSISTGTGISGAGGALLFLFFFAPWLSACGLRITGKDITFGIQSPLGGQTEGAYPFLVLIPILGLVALGLAIMSLMQRSTDLKNRTAITIIVGCVSIGLLIIVGFGFLDAANQTANVLQIEYGYFMSFLGAIAIAGGGLIDLKMPSSVLRLPTSAVSGAQPYQAPPYAPPASPQYSSGMKSRARLTIQSGPLANQTFPIMGDSLTIGRGSDCNLRLNDRSVSRQHARIRYAQGAWFIQDQDSSGGLFINGQPQKAARLNPGDRIQIGGSTLVFYPEG